MRFSIASLFSCLLWFVLLLRLLKFLVIENLFSFLKDLRFSIRAFASRKSMKKQKRDRKLDSVEESIVVDKSFTETDDKSVDNLTSQIPTNVPSRSSVLQACSVTCSLIAALGLIIRQVRIYFSSPA